MGAAVGVVTTTVTWGGSVGRTVGLTTVTTRNGVAVGSAGPSGVGSSGSIVTTRSPSSLSATLTDSARGVEVTSGVGWSVGSTSATVTPTSPSSARLSVIWSDCGAGTGVAVSVGSRVGNAGSASTARTDVRFRTASMMNTPAAPHPANQAQGPNQPRTAWRIYIRPDA